MIQMQMMCVDAAMIPVLMKMFVPAHKVKLSVMTNAFFAEKCKNKRNPVKNDKNAIVFKDKEKGLESKHNENCRKDEHANEHVGLAARKYELDVLLNEHGNEMLHIMPFD